MIAPEGKVILIPLFFLFIAGMGIYTVIPSTGLKWVNLVLVVLTVFSLYFFRDPERIVPNLDGFLSPADGKIVNITSVIGHTGNVGQSNYAASKAAVISMSKSLALEYAKKNITVNCISPGYITTNMTDQINEKWKEIIKSKIPMDKFGLPKDVANTVIFLSSESSSYITGQTIHVNGGMYMG